MSEESLDYLIACIAEWTSKEPQVYLVQETLDALKESLLTKADVLWVGSKDGNFQMSWDEFVETFKDVHYYGGHIGPLIATDLVVVGEDWWLERVEYDGMETWVFKKKPWKKLIGYPFKRVVAVDYETRPPTVDGLNRC